MVRIPASLRRARAEPLGVSRGGLRPDGPAQRSLPLDPSTVSHIDSPGKVTLADKVGFLRCPASYTPAPARVTAIETHLAWVFLAGKFAFKLKKPVRQDVLDYHTRAARRRACLAEVRLNRRLAAHVYLGVTPLVRTTGGRLSLDGSGTPVDWLVRMRRLNARDMLDRRIEAGFVGPEELGPAADLLARFYRSASPVPTTPSDVIDRLRRTIETTREDMMSPLYGLPEGIVSRLADRQLAFLDERPALLRARSRDGRIVEGHGDLKPEHFYLGSPPAVIDCLEFSRQLRVLDPAEDLSLLSVECERLGHPEVAAFFFARYSEQTGDRPPPDLLAFYRSVRALIRAKLSAGHLRDEPVRNPRRWRARTLRYLWLSLHSLPTR